MMDAVIPEGDRSPDLNIIQGPFDSEPDGGGAEFGGHRSAGHGGLEFAGELCVRLRSEQTVHHTVSGVSHTPEGILIVGVRAAFLIEFLDGPDEVFAPASGKRISVKERARLEGSELVFSLCGGEGSF